MHLLDKVAIQNKLTLGLVFPLESYAGSVPKMENQEALAQLAEASGFSALWFRDVPFHDPQFGDAGQMYDPWVYMAHIMNHTTTIGLATGSIILPLRHPVHTLKSINSLQLLSKGRITIGIASGDRPKEYPAFNKVLDNRAELFRDHFHYLQQLASDFPKYSSQSYGSAGGSIDVLPKYNSPTPFLVTGHSGQTLEWIAKHGDGWLYYPRNPYMTKHIIEDWHNALTATQSQWKPYLQSLYIDLQETDSHEPAGIHLGFRSGPDFLVSHLQMLRELGVNHVVINLKYSSRPVEEVIQQLGEQILSIF